MDTTTEVRCEFWGLIKYSCAHCLGHVGPDYDTLADDDD